MLLTSFSGKLAISLVLYFIPIGTWYFSFSLYFILKNCANKKKKIEEEQVKQVEESLFKRATGYTYKKIIPVKLKREYYNEEGKKCVEEYVEEAETEEES